MAGCGAVGIPNPAGSLTLMSMPVTLCSLSGHCPWFLFPFTMAFGGGPRLVQDGVGVVAVRHVGTGVGQGIEPVLYSRSMGFRPSPWW